MRHSLATFLFCIFSSSALAQTTVPHTFTSGSAARASEVNENFQALATAINNLTTRVNKLEGQLVAGDLAGTYSNFVFGVLATPQPSNSARVESYNSRGTLILSANGTFSMSGTINGYSLTWNMTGGTVSGQTEAIPDNRSGTWSLSGNTLTLSSSGGGTASLAVTAGGRLFITGGPTGSGEAGGELVLFVRSS